MITGFSRVVGGAFLAGTLLIAACGGSGDPPTSKIFQEPVWDGSERATYDLLREGRELYGICILETEPGNDTTTLRRLCEDADGRGFRDDGMAVVDASTLRPLESERVVIEMDNREEYAMAGTYDEDSALLTRTDRSLDDSEIFNQLETDRELPEPDEESPDPGYYDDETLYWLMRGIPLEEGWEGAYHNVNLGIARIVIAEVLVEGRETVEVPAGEFDTWKIRLRTASITQRFWVEVDSPHRMIRADIEDASYVLRDYE